MKSFLLPSSVVLILFLSFTGAFAEDDTADPIVEIHDYIALTEYLGRTDLQYLEAGLIDTLSYDMTLSNRLALYYAFRKDPALPTFINFFLPGIGSMVGGDVRAGIWIFFGASASATLFKAGLDADIIGLWLPSLIVYTACWVTGLVSPSVHAAKWNAVLRDGLYLVEPAFSGDLSLGSDTPGVTPAGVRVDVFALRF